MRHYAVAVFVASLAALPTLAQAMDCKKASTPIERMICADSRLKNADAAMGKAYTALLKSTDDADIHAMLVASQRRWIETRDSSFGDLDNSTNGQSGDSYSKEDQRDIVLEAIQDRTGQLGEMSKTTPRQPRLVQVAQAQRAFASRFTGGPFAGFSTSCDFLPQSDHYDYGCFGTHFYQNKDRVCSLTQDWASGGLYETRSVANVVDGKARLVATCKPGESECSPGTTKTDEPDWSVTPDSLDADAKRIYDQQGKAALTPLDAEMDDQDDDHWLESCLTRPDFPAAPAAR
jgi:uncharacterized protein YecT (DUF1311 family)